MGIYDDIAAIDAAAFVNPDSMPGTEAIVYWPQGESSQAVTVNAQVWRGDVETINGLLMSAAPQLKIFVPAAVVPNPDKGDVFLLADAIGGDVRQHPYMRRIEEDAAGFLLELR